MAAQRVGTENPQQSAGSGSPKTQAGAWGTGQNRTANNLLVALVTASGTTSAGAISENTSYGWTKRYENAGSGQAYTKAAIFTLVAAGGDTAPTFQSTISGTSARCRMSVTLYEYGDSINPGVTPVIDTGGSNEATSGTLTVTTAANLTSAQGQAMAVQVMDASTSSANTWGTNNSFTNDYTDGQTTYNHWVDGFRYGAPSGSPLSWAPTHTHASAGIAGAIIVVIAGTPPPPLMARMLAQRRQPRLNADRLRVQQPVYR